MLIFTNILSTMQRHLLVEVEAAVVVAEGWLVVSFMIWKWLLLFSFHLLYLVFTNFVQEMALWSMVMEAGIIEVVDMVEMDIPVAGGVASGVVAEEAGMVADLIISKKWVAITVRHLFASRAEVCHCFSSFLG